MIIREYKEKDLEAMIRIWNEVVEDGIAFPQEETLDIESGADFFSSQSYTGVAEEDGKISGVVPIAVRRNNGTAFLRRNSGLRCRNQSRYKV